MQIKTIAQIVALVLYFAAWLAKKSLGWEIPPSVLVAVGGLLTTLVMHSQPVSGTWGLRVTKLLGVVFAVVAVAFSVAPTETASALKLSNDIVSVVPAIDIAVPPASLPTQEPVAEPPAADTTPSDAGGATDSFDLDQ
jgi:hypothetical protein